MIRDRAKRSVSVTIAGQKLTIKTDAPESYVRTVAGHVDAKVRPHLHGGKVPTYGMAVMAAMELADELMRERSGRKSLKRKVRERTERLLRALETVSTMAEGER